MADNIFARDANGNTIILSTKDIGGGVQVARHIVSDSSGNDVNFDVAKNSFNSLKVTLTDALTDAQLHSARVDGIWLLRANNSQESFFSQDRVLMTASIQYGWDAGRTNGQGTKSFRRISMATGLMASGAANDASGSYQGETTNTRLFRVMGYNGNANAQYLLIWDRATAPNRASDTPTHIIRIPPGEFDKSLDGIILQAGFYYTWQSVRANNGALSTAGTIQDWNFIKG